MSWAKLDDKFYAHPKILRVGLAATGLYARGLSYAAAYETDGEIPEAWARLVGTPKLINTLCDVALWTPSDGSYHINDWLEFNISAKEWEEKKAQAAERQRRYMKRIRNA